MKAKIDLFEMTDEEKAEWGRLEKEHFNLVDVCSKAKERTEDFKREIQRKNLHKIAPKTLYLLSENAIELDMTWLHTRHQDLVLEGELCGNFAWDLSGTFFEVRLELRPVPQEASERAETQITVKGTDEQVCEQLGAILPEIVGITLRTQVAMAVAAETESEEKSEA